MRARRAQARRTPVLVIADNLSAVIEPGAKRSEFQYDALSRRTQKRTADLPTGPPQIWSWTYDGEGNALTHTRPDGTLIEHEYDALNRVTATSYSNAPLGSPSARSYAYDGNSNLTRISETNGAQTVAVESVYDAFDRPTQITDANSRIWTQVFDDADQRRSLSSAGVPQVQWNYDLGGRPDQITVSGAGTYTLVYDKADRNTRIEHPNGVTTSHEFDDASRIQEIEHSRAGVIAKFQYDYDDNGNRIAQIEENGAAPITTTFVYDKADRLTTISEPGKHTVYTLDGNSNRIATTEGPSAGVVTRRFTAEFDARNQIVEQQQFDSGNSLIGTVEFEFDLNGNLIGQTSGSAVTAWRYDALDRLIETTPPTGPPTQYRYGPGDVRIAKVRAGEEIRYHYDGERLVLETNAIGNPQKHYAYTAAGLLNTATLGVTPEYRSAHLDAQTSPIAISSSTGNILNRSRFDAYGVETSLFGIRDQAISFQGYWSGTELEENGQLLSAARIYIPGLGIFGERDPVEGIANEPAGFNAYVIGRSNPHYWMDPDGRCAGATNPVDCYFIEMEQAAAVTGLDPDTPEGHLAATEYINGRMLGRVSGAWNAFKSTVQFVADVPGMAVDMIPGVDVGSIDRMSDVAEGAAKLLTSPIDTVQTGIDTHGVALSEALARNDFFGAGKISGGVEGGVLFGAATALIPTGLATSSRTVRGSSNGPEVGILDIDLDLGMSQGSHVRSAGWAPPKNWQGPSKERGAWKGQVGNSPFGLFDDVAAAAGVPSGTSINFVRGAPDFGPYSVKTPAGSSGVFDVKGLVFDHVADASTIVKHLAQEAGISQAAVRRWLRKADVRMHHFEGDTIQLVPTKLHTSVHHTGSRSMNGQ